jgi:pyruvate kinase
MLDANLVDQLKTHLAKIARPVELVASLDDSVKSAIGFPPPPRLRPPRNMLRTKVVCTLGPATSSVEMIRGLVLGGMDVARVNMSHGEPEEHGRLIDLVRSAARDAGRPVAILADLAGPKIRVGDLQVPIDLKAGSTVVVAPQESARPGEIPTTYAPLAHEIRVGDVVLMDDGLLELRCVGVEGDRTRLEVVRGGVLKSRKGINLPTMEVSAPSLTTKDIEDLDFALQRRVEDVGLSFVRRAEDVIDLKRRVGYRALVVAKIE